MQHITLIAVGKAGGFYVQGIEEYALRLRPFCRFEAVELPEEPLKEKGASPAQVATVLEKEGRRILAAVPKGSALWALCVEGRQMDSAAFAQKLEEVAQSGAPAVALAIGSSNGLAESVKRAAQVKLSLSAMTLPHQLARLVLTEQLYRAMTIRAGTRYHK